MAILLDWKEIMVASALLCCEYIFFTCETDLRSESEPGKLQSALYHNYRLVYNFTICIFNYVQTWVKLFPANNAAVKWAILSISSYYHTMTLNLISIPKQWSMMNTKLILKQTVTLRVHGTYEELVTSHDVNYIYCTCFMCQESFYIQEHLNKNTTVKQGIYKQETPLFDNWAQKSKPFFTFGVFCQMEPRWWYCGPKK